MRAYRRWIGMGVALGIAAGLLPVVQGRVALKGPDGPLARIARVASPEKVQAPSLEGLRLEDMSVLPRRVTAPLPGGRTAELTLDPELQRSTLSAMQRVRIPEAGVVLMDVKTGKLLVYASHVSEGAPFDVNVRATAPAASVFKVVTAAALVENAGKTSVTEQCYHGGRSALLAEELEDNPKKDKWCATLAMAMGRSINPVFGKLARRHLKPAEVEAMAGAFGFGAPVPFVVPNEASKVEMPEDPLEFARAAAGFWHTTLSPLAGASLAQVVASGGVALEPRLVARVVQGKEEIWKDERPARVVRRAIRPETATELRKMMAQTVAAGSAWKAFHDPAGQPYLSVPVAGKTGTLTDKAKDRHYTWFVGYAPAEQPEVAVSVMVVNTPIWKVKGPDLARQVLKAYFSAPDRRPQGSELGSAASRSQDTADEARSREDLAAR